MGKRVKNEFCGENSTEQGKGNIIAKAQIKNMPLKVIYCRNQKIGAMYSTEKKAERKEKKHNRNPKKQIC